MSATATLPDSHTEWSAGQQAVFIHHWLPGDDPGYAIPAERTGQTAELLEIRDLRVPSEEERMGYVLRFEDGETLIARVGELSRVAR